MTNESSQPQPKRLTGELKQLWDRACECMSEKQAVDFRVLASWLGGPGPVRRLIGEGLLEQSAEDKANGIVRETKIPIYVPGPAIDRIVRIGDVDDVEDAEDNEDAGDDASTDEPPEATKPRPPKTKTIVHPSDLVREEVFAIVAKLPRKERTILRIVLSTIDFDRDSGCRVKIREAKALLSRAGYDTVAKPQIIATVNLTGLTYFPQESNIIVPPWFSELDLRDREPDRTKKVTS